MTTVSTGVVYFDPTRDMVVHRGWDSQETVIGVNTWPRPGQRGAGTSGNRELVGNPGHDLVVWVESVDEARGDLIVVRASTGEELARTPVPNDPGREVNIASVDPEAVYFATRGPGPVTGSGVPGSDVWTWRWSDGAPPEDARDIAGFVVDVSAGVWVVRPPRGGLQILDNAGQVMLTTDHPGDKQSFGDTLSPDGRYWRSWGNEVIETATGEVTVVPYTGGQIRQSAWSDVDELAVIVNNTLMVCTYPSGACSEPVDFPDSDGAELNMPTS